MSSPTPTRSQRLKLTLLSLAGTLAVALPTVQVLRLQGAELHAARVAQAGLDPLARATALQRSLLTHRDLAAPVLRGDLALEPERRLRQTEVDHRNSALATALGMVAAPEALDEYLALQADWTGLSGRIAQRTLSADDSNLGHRLLVEQVLQIMDLVVDPLVGTGPVPAELQASVLQARLAVHQALGGAPLAQTLDPVLQEQTQLADRLKGRESHLQQARTGLLVLLLGLGLACLWLSRSLQRKAPADQPPLPPGAPTSRDEAARLLHRLRQEPQRSAGDSWAPTLPPPSEFR